MQFEKEEVIFPQNIWYVAKSCRLSVIVLTRDIVLFKFTNRLHA